MFSFCQSGSKPVERTSGYAYSLRNFSIKLASAYFIRVDNTENVVPRCHVRNMASAENRKCKKSQDNICNIYRHYNLPKQRKILLDFVRKAYITYVRMKLGEQDQSETYI